MPFANLVRWTAAERLWQGQGMVLDSHHLISWLAGIGIRVPAGFGVSLMPFRSPYNAALEARSVALASGHPVVACFGPGSALIQEGVLGARYRSPLRASREYVQIVRGLLDGGLVELAGEYYQVSANLIGSPSPPVTVGLGVLRPGMAEVAGEVADVAVTWLGSAGYLGDVLVPAVRSADRRIGGQVSVTAIVPVALAGPDRDVARLAAAACGSHIQLPHYQETLSLAGITLHGDERADALSLVDGGVFLYGTVDEIHARLKEFRDAGVDEIVLNATGVGQALGPRAALGDLQAILDAVPAN
ncbi:MAG TPA: LLM class flavin-dependent oxidoreductase [Kineosporiaceae bacterium]|nr:LLM class flavin-dependent oxidoreductase [Kineosporiaceae bacterium]